jgi:acyloxyacyl hydrolase
LYLSIFEFAKIEKFRKCSLIIRQGSHKLFVCLGVALTEQLAYIHDAPVVNAMDKLCSYLPNTLQGWCVDLLDTYGQDIINLLELRFTPDSVCLQLGLCHNATCHLFPRPTVQLANEQQLKYEQKQFSAPSPPSELRQKLRKVRQHQGGWDPIGWIKDIIQRVFTDHKPLVDIDGDNFSTMKELRGYSWRGKVSCHSLRVPSLLLTKMSCGCPGLR